jgi:integrase
MKLKGVTYSDGKNARYYYYRSKNGQKISLGRGPKDSAEFLRRYADAVDADSKKARRTKAQQKSIAATCEAFKNSATYARYSTAYRKIFLTQMDLICAKTIRANAKISDLKRKHIRADIATLAPNPARNRLKVWRALCQMAVELGWVNEMATEGIKAPKAPETEGHKAWDAVDISKYREKWPYGTVQRTCFELLYWTAARTVDAVRLCPSMVGSDGVMTFTQVKTRHPAFVPWTCPLAEWADSFQADLDHLHQVLPTDCFTYLETSQGKSRSAKGLSNLISSSAKKAGIERRTAHGLRASRLTAIAEAGAQANAIMAWGGHKTLSEAQKYIASADRKKLIMGTEQDRNSANTSVKLANTR